MSHHHGWVPQDPTRCQTLGGPEAELAVSRFLPEKRLREKGRDVLLFSWTGQRYPHVGNDVHPYLKQTRLLE